MSPRKLMFWLFACIFLVCALRAGLLTSADQYIYHLRNMHASTFAYRYDDFWNRKETVATNAIPSDCCYVRVKTYRSKEP